MGRDYQAVCPDLVPVERKSPEELSDRALLVWSPSKEITDDDRERKKLILIFFSIIFLVFSRQVHSNGEGEVWVQW